MINCVRDEIKVFISSRCGVDRYDEVRAELKQMLEDTGFISVYLFEDGIGTTMTAQQDYLYSLDDSDVCIFLVDNKDNVTPPILAEMKRAKDFPKKSIYLFCYEDDDNQTQVEKDLIGANGSRFLRVNQFKDFANKGFESLLNDIVRIYQYYCKGRFQDVEFEVSDNSTEYVRYDGSDDLPTKEILNKLDKCNIFIQKKLNLYFKEEAKNTSLLDDYLVQFLEVMFEGKPISNFNAFLFLEEVKQYHDADFHEIVVKRWGAIQKFWMGDLAGCYAELDEVLIIAKEKGMAEWLIQDILIDLRNVSTYEDATENRITQNSPVHKQISEQQRNVYYPVLDRYERILYEDMNKEMEHRIKLSPYSNIIGNSYSGFINHVVNIFCVAAMNGSLSHIDLIPRRLKHILFNISVHHQSVPFTKELLKMSLYSGDTKDIKEYARTFNGIYSKLNHKDVQELYEFCQYIPLEFRSVISKVTVLRDFGLFADEQYFNEKYSAIKNKAITWLTDDNRLVVYGDHYIKMFRNIYHRIDHNDIVEFSLGILKNGLYRYADQIFELLLVVDYHDINQENISCLKETINELLRDDKRYKKVYKLNNLLIYWGRNYKDLFSEVELALGEVNPEFYSKLYKFETVFDQPITDNFIELSIVKIEKRIKEQGRNGTLIGYGENPFNTIRNIVERRNTIEIKIINHILKACFDTVVCPTQTFYDKTSAMELVLFLANKHTEIHEKLVDYLDHIKDYRDDSESSSDVFFGEETGIPFRYSLVLLESLIRNNGDVDFLQLVVNSGEYSNKDKIGVLKLIESTYEGHTTVANTNLYPLLLQFVIGLLNDENHDVRYHAYNGILKMINEDSSELILNVLSKTFDEESSYIKYLILDNWSIFDEFNSDVSQSILDRAKVDNNFVVKEKCKLIERIRAEKLSSFKYKIESINNNKNADKLFKAFLEYCELNEIQPRKLFTIEEIANILPRGTAGVSNYSTYGFSLMSMMSNQKNRDYFIFVNSDMTKILTEHCNNNYDRDNYLWRKQYLKEQCKINPVYWEEMVE